MILLIPIDLEPMYCADCLSIMVCRYVETHNDFAVPDDLHPELKYLLHRCSGCGVHWFNRRGERTHDMEDPRDGIERYCPHCFLGPPNSRRWN